MNKWKIISLILLIALISFGYLWFLSKNDLYATRQILTSKTNDYTKLQIEYSNLLDDHETAIKELDTENKRYVADRKQECYDLARQEDVRYNNYEDYWYNENNDSCMIVYSYGVGQEKPDCNNLFGFNKIFCEDDKFIKEY